MLSNRTLTEEQTLIRRHFTDFFEDGRFEEKYLDRVRDMMSIDKARLLMDIGDLLDFTPSTSTTTSGATGLLDGASLGACVIQQPGKYLPLLELALHDVVLRHQPEYLKVDYRSRAVHVGFEGPVGRVLSPRELFARHLNTMVALEGIVTRQSSNRPRVLETVHYCVATNKFTKKEFRDQLTPMIDSSHLPTVNVMPKTDMEGNPLRTELGLSTFIDSQCAVLQEAPERAPTGQLPRNVEVRFDDDLVDAVKPGDRVLLVGVFMPYTTADSKSFQSIVLVNHVVSMQAYTFMTRPVRAVEERLAAFARREVGQHGPRAVLETLAKAVAPTIYGMECEKQAILLMMVGGVERQAHNTHVRGDINVLLVGEPSTAKSQLLRFVLGVAPLALSTTGKGSSGVGLTAAVAVDSYTGERSLSAGAMVLADRGILCIDEFDKMGAQDRVAMHEAMEQQTVTIAKAGIHASLNARCSVLAAANPIYGFYSVHHRLAFNVGLPESLLSRFDLTFIVLDQHASDYNRRIGRHILRNHMKSQPVLYDQAELRTVVDGVAPSTRDENLVSRRLDTNDGAEAAGEGAAIPNASMFEREMNSSGESIVSVDFLRTFVQMAKRGEPMLTETSQQLISQHYVQLRAEQQDASRDGFFITARTLEAIVRLSTAHAKLRLSSAVEDVDVDAAMDLLRASVHAASTATQQRKEDNRHSLEEAQAVARGQPGVAVVASTRTSGRSNEAGATHPGEGGEDEPALQRARTEASTSSAVLAAQSLSRIVIEALKGFQREQQQTVTLAALHSRLGVSSVSMGQLRDALTEMQGDSFIFEKEEDGGDDTVQFI